MSDDSLTDRVLRYLVSLPFPLLPPKPNVQTVKGCK